MKRICLCIMVVLIAGLVAFPALATAQEAKPPGAAGEPPPPPPKVNKVGMEVPPWEAKTVDTNEVITSESFEGKDYAMVFVNSSCAACRMELSELRKRDFTGNLEIIVASVDVNPERSIATYKGSLQLPYPVVDDSDQHLSGVFAFFFTPATVIVDKEGKLAYTHGGFAMRHRQAVLAEFDKYAN